MFQVFNALAKVLQSPAVTSTIARIVVPKILDKEEDIRDYTEKLYEKIKESINKTKVIDLSVNNNYNSATTTNSTITQIGNTIYIFPDKDSVLAMKDLNSKLILLQKRLSAIKSNTSNEGLQSIENEYNLLESEIKEIMIKAKLE